MTDVNFTERDIELLYYNKKGSWDLFDGNKERIQRAQVTVPLIPSEVNSVLDAGCGNGVFTNIIEKPFVVGLDFAMHPLTNVKTHKICASISDLPIKDNSFDLITLNEILEHLNDETFNKAIAEIKRLRSKYLLISVPFNENIEYDLCKCSLCGNIFNAYHHYRKFDASCLNNLFPEYDIKKIEYSSCRIFNNQKLKELEHLFGYYAFSDWFVCNKCGGPPIKPHMLIRLIFGPINLLEFLIKTVMGLKKPYHMLLLLKLKN